MDPITVTQTILIEILNDNTNDAEDYWQICFDGNADGGTAPQIDDLRIDIVGHSTVTWYKGTGTGWTAIATPSATQFQWKDSISASPVSSTPHWILELMIEKTSVGVVAQFWARIAVYDASNSEAGVQAWPPTSRDVPADWGDFLYDSNAIPSGLNPTPEPTTPASSTPAPSSTPPDNRQQRRHIFRSHLARRRRSNRRQRSHRRKRLDNLTSAIGNKNNNSASGTKHQKRKYLKTNPAAPHHFRGSKGKLPFLLIAYSRIIFMSWNFSMKKKTFVERISDEKKQSSVCISKVNMSTQTC